MKRWVMLVLCLWTAYGAFTEVNIGVGEKSSFNGGNSHNIFTHITTDTYAPINKKISFMLQSESYAGAELPSGNVYADVWGTVAGNYRTRKWFARLQSTGNFRYAAQENINAEIMPSIKLGYDAGAVSFHIRPEGYWRNTNGGSIGGEISLGSAVTVGTSAVLHPYISLEGGKSDTAPLNMQLAVGSDVSWYPGLPMVFEAGFEYASSGPFIEDNIDWNAKTISWWVSTSIQSGFFDIKAISTISRPLYLSLNTQGSVILDSQGAYTQLGLTGEAEYTFTSAWKSIISGGIHTDIPSDSQNHIYGSAGLEVVYSLR